MKLITRLTAMSGTAALVASAAVLVVAGPASAHTIEASANCQTGVTVDLKSYAASKPGKPAVDPVYKDWDEIITDTPAVPAVPPVTHVVHHHDLVTAAIPAVKTTYVQEWKFVQKNHPGNVQWHTADWNPGIGWDKTNEHRDSTTVLVQGHDAIPAVYKDWDETITDVPGKDAIPAVTHVLPHHDLVSAGTPAVPAKTNHVLVKIDGSAVADVDFSTSYSATFPFANKYVTHTWSVDVTAWDNSAYSFHRSGTTAACELPVVNANPAATIVATCGHADVDLTNAEQEYQQNKTAAVTIWVDGKFTEAVAVTGGSDVKRSYDFAEDSGDHTIVVKNAESEGGAILASATVSSDCIAPQPENKVTYGDWITGKYGCDDTTVTETRTVTDTPYVLVDDEWVLDTENATTTTETHDRALTAAEIKALDCPVVVVVTPPAPPAGITVVTPAAPAPQKFIAASDDTLASTGSDELGTEIGLGAGAILVLLLGAGIVIGVRRRGATR